MIKIGLNWIIKDMHYKQQANNLIWRASVAMACSAKATLAPSLPQAFFAAAPIYRGGTHVKYPPLLPQAIFFRGPSQLPQATFSLPQASRSRNPYLVCGRHCVFPISAIAFLMTNCLPKNVYVPRG